MLKSILFVFFALFFSTQAFAQSTPLQGGPWTPGHAPMYVGAGSAQPVIQDSGPASGGGFGLGLSEQLLQERSPTNTYPAVNAGTGPYGTNWCDYDAPITNANGYHYLCLGPNAQGGGIIAYGSAGAANQLPLTMNINGVGYQFPFVINGIVGPNSSTINDYACWNNTSGTLLNDCSPFTSSNTWANDNFFKNGRPWADIRAWGAKGDGSTDDTAAIQNAINYIGTTYGSGTVYVPPSNNLYCVKTSGGVVVNYPGIRIVFGSNAGQTSFSACGVDTTVLTMKQPFDSVEHGYIIGKGANNDQGTFGASQPTVLFTGNCVFCLGSYIQVYGGKFGVEMDPGAADSVLENSNISYTYGSLLYLIDAGFWLKRNKLDQLWPYAQLSSPYTISNWSANTVYSAGTVVITQNYLIQYTVGGTSGNSAPTLKNYLINMTDGTATAQIVAPQQSFYALSCAGCTELQASDIDASGPFTAGYAMTNDSAGNPGAYFKCTRCIAGQNINEEVFLNSGKGAYFTDVEFGSCISTGCSIVVDNASFTGDVDFKGGTIFGPSSNCFTLGNSGGLTMSGVTLSACSNAGFEATPGVSHFSLIGNKFGASNAASNGTGAKIDTGSSNNYFVVFNLCINSVVCVSDGGTGSNKASTPNY